MKKMIIDIIVLRASFLLWYLVQVFAVDRLHIYIIIEARLFLAYLIYNVPKFIFMYTYLSAHYAIGFSDNGHNY